MPITVWRKDRSSIITWPVLLPASPIIRVLDNRKIRMSPAGQTEERPAGSGRLMDGGAGQKNER